MRPEAKAFLHDIQSACALLERFVSDKAFDDYAGDALLRSGTERQLEIVGEALSQLSKIDPESAKRISHHRRIIALRNILVHGYAKVDHRVIWNIVEHDLPVLRREVDALMREGQAE